MYPVHYHIAITEFVIQLASCFLFEESGGILFPAKPFDTARELQNKSAAKLTSYLKSDESKISITTSTRAGGYDRVAARDYAKLIFCVSVSSIPSILFKAEFSTAFGLNNNVSTEFTQGRKMKI